MKNLLTNIFVILTIAYTFTSIGILIGKRNADVMPLPQSEKTVKTTPSPDNSDKLNLNTATKEELINLPGIGPSLADAIIAYREEREGFYSIYELETISGIGDKKIQQIEDLICAE